MEGLSVDWFKCGEGRGGIIGGILQYKQLEGSQVLFM